MTTTLLRRTDDPRWVRPALLGLLVATGVLYLWGLGASGWANSFYSAAVQAGSVSWKAFFYGSSDAANSITVDKPPASLWLMALSVRAFGLSSWSILVPQALAGVASVGVLYATVRRWFSPAAGLLAGLVLATTPVATLMFRFNNPDALLVLLLVLAAYATVRATERASTKWLMLAGVLVGFGFLTKMLQALLVMPALALVFLLAAPAGLWRRVGQLLLAGLAMVVGAGWWIAIVELVPAKYRPYVGGSQANSILELTLGYNGLGRLTGNETGSVGPGAQSGGFGGGGGPGGGFGGQTGLGRLFASEMGGQISWLLPAALAFLLAGLWLTRRAPRTDRTRAGLLLWGGWLVVTALVFSFMQGIIHAYYTVALAPAISALVGIGSLWMWRMRDRLPARIVLAVVVVGSAVWSYVLLGRTPDWNPWLRPAVLAAGGVAALGLLAGTRRYAVARVAAVVAMAAVLAGPLSYSVATASTGQGGSIPSAGPAGQGGQGGPGGGPGGMGGPGMRRDGNLDAAGGLPAGPPPGGGAAQAPAGQASGGQASGGQASGGQASGGQAPTGQAGQARGGGAGGMGALLNGSNPGAKLTTMLRKDSGSYTWVAATVGSNSASGYQLATGEPVMPIGGFNGSDPSPTLAQFKAYVAAGKVHYFIGGGLADLGSEQGTSGSIQTAGRGGFPGARGGTNSTSGQIAAWVAANFSSTTVDGVQIYDLTAQNTASTTGSTASSS
ncbi:ArnT family glycosyltransferase [Actinopolymorpha rutila]|uniref:4-amino-4-deoxy-L-arabinose transferase-like glycosyltransferase n=1 Tax=Actinopolymorpha rutila TaxID=446787 RepID=A0A852ZHR4_9ACTN|nr:glycosyltransferase family 39 protein [Actinopolymorpha rutila]NYH88620.1 4-amino-4-deoxy-L-arabinose transferase-like glycosyltransferase [Actinopolymorpha rutila]